MMSSCLSGALTRFLTIYIIIENILKLSKNKKKVLFLLFIIYIHLINALSEAVNIYAQLYAFFLYTACTSLIGHVMPLNLTSVL